MSTPLHTLRVVTADGPIERRVAGKERLTIRTGVGSDLVSQQVKNLSRVEFTPGGAGGGSVFVGDAGGRGAFYRVSGAGRFELGDERWPISQVGSFLLAAPVTPKVEIPTSRHTPWRVTFIDEERPPEIVELVSAVIQGEVQGPESAWRGPTMWGIELDKIATIERFESVEPEPVEEPIAEPAVA